MSDFKSICIDCYKTWGLPFDYFVDKQSAAAA